MPRDSLVEVLARFEIIERLEAIVRELEPGGDGAEVAGPIAFGLVEELKTAVATDEGAEA